MPDFPLRALPAAPVSLPTAAKAPDGHIQVAIPIASPSSESAPALPPINSSNSESAPALPSHQIRSASTQARLDAFQNGHAYRAARDKNLVTFKYVGIAEAATGVAVTLAGAVTSLVGTSTTAGLTTKLGVGLVANGSLLVLGGAAVGLTSWKKLKKRAIADRQELQHLTVANRVALAEDRAALAGNQPPATTSPAPFYSAVEEWDVENQLPSQPLPPAVA